MGVPSRKIARDEIAALLTATSVFTGGVQANELLKIAGKDLFVTVHSAPAELTEEDQGIDDTGNYRARYMITWWAERKDASNAEDNLDLMSKTVFDVVMDNRTNDNWDDITPMGATLPSYLKIDGIQYRSEILNVETLHFVDN
jgi:hypothetical protein